jgi:hypothetical protein
MTIYVNILFTVYQNLLERHEMKNNLKKIVCFLFVFGLFNGFVTGQTDTSEISLIELKKMEGTFAGSLTIVTKDTTFELITSWKTNDSSIVFGDFGANYLKKNFAFQVRSLGEINARNQGYYKNLDTFIKPDTLSIAFESIERIIYKEPYESNYSEGSGTSEETPSRFGGEVNWRNGEFTVAVLNQVQIGIYRMVVKVNTTFLPDGGSTRISSSALYTLGYMLAASLAMGTIHREDVGESGQTVYALILGSPLLLTNAEHHLFLVNAPGNYQTDPFALSSFVAFRTDYFGPEWIVYSTDVGLQFEFNWENEDGYSFGNSMAVKIGNEFTYDGKKGDFWTSRPFLAWEITF